MSTGLLTQLETYYSDVEATHHDVTPDQVLGYMDRVREVPTPAPVPVRSRPKAWIAVAVAAAVTLLVAALPILLGVLNDDSPPATDPTRTTVVPTSTTPSMTLPMASVAPPTVSWEAISFGLGEGPQHGVVASARDEFLVLQPALDGDLRNILWTSPDGRTWEEHELALPDLTMNDFFGKARGTYIISTPLGSTYLSDDLDEWTVWDVPEKIWAIASTDDAVVGKSGGTIYRATPDFNTTQVSNPFGADSDVHIEHITSFDNTLYVLVLSDTMFDEDGNSYTSATVWSSADGLTWNIEVGGEKWEGSSGISSNDERLLAVLGNSYWTVSNGQPGTLVTGPDPGNPPVTSDLAWVVATEHGFLLASTLSMPNANPPSSWRSTIDGSSLEPIDSWASIDESQPFVGSVAAVNGTILVRDPHWRENGLSPDGEIDGGWVLGTVEPAS